MIAFLGTGLLGANFVRALRRRNEAVQVWNRSPEKARALESDGATACATPADAVRGASRVHLALYDDGAVDSTLEQASAGLAPGAVIVDHTTTAPVPTAKRVAYWIARGFPCLHAPVFMGPQNALDGTGTMLASGTREIFDPLEAVLRQMTGRLVYLGADPARAASIKLLGNLFLVAMTGGLADMFTLARALGVPGEDAAQVFEWFNPAAMAPARANRILTGDLTRPSWTLAMARKDARLMIESAERNGDHLAVIPAVAAVMDRWIDGGHAAEDWMVIGRKPA